MKTKSLYFAAALTVLALLSVSCDKEENQPTGVTGSDGTAEVVDKNTLTGTRWYLHDVEDVIFYGYHISYIRDVYLDFETDSTGMGTVLLLEAFGDVYDPPKENHHPFRYSLDTACRKGFYEQYDSTGVGKGVIPFEYNLQKKILVFPDILYESTVFHLVED